MTDETLFQLIHAARDKDQKAQTKLINTFWIDVFSFVLKKVQDENDADEITVSVFSKVLNKLDLYDPNFQFKTWILTIAQNTVIDFWRRKSRETEDASDELHNLKNTFEKSPEELLIDEEDKERILQIIAGLDSNYQDIIRLRFYEEKSLKEISDELGISLSNTKIRIMRAKKVLAELLTQNELDSE